MGEPLDLVIEGASVAAPDRIRTGAWVGVRGGRIAASGEGPAPPAARRADARGRWILPGFVDTLLHGGNLYQPAIGKFDHLRGTFDPSDERVHEGFLEVPRIHALHGTTSLLVSTGCQPKARVERFLRIGAGYVERPDRTGGRILGLDLEGPFMKDPVYAGAHDSENFLEPNDRNLGDFLAAGGGRLKKVNIVPEWGEVAFASIRRAVREGLVVAVGHTGCTADELRRAADEGARVFVHLGNGPASQNFKQGGAVDAVLAMRGAMAAEIIPDLHHVAPLWVNAFLHAVRFRALAVTDATFLAAAPRGVREFRLGPFTRILSEDGTRLSLKEKPNTLAGSVCTMDRAFGNVLTLFRHAPEGHVVGPIFDHPLSLEEAVLRALPLFTENPAGVYGHSDRIGRIAPGLLADLLVASISEEGRKVSVAVERTFVEGREIPR